MDLIALCCKKCGSPLIFDGSLICKCPSCGTPHALVGSNGSDLLHSVSFLPYVQSNDGKMTKSLKIKLIEKIEETSEYVACSIDLSTKYCLRFKEDNQSVYCNSFIEDSEKPFKVAKYRVDKALDGYINSGTIWKPIKEPKYINEIFFLGDVFLVEVVPVMVRNGNNNFLAGHRIVIRVYDKKYEDDANAFSAKIQEWFGIIPDVSLARI